MENKDQIQAQEPVQATMQTPPPQDTNNINKSQEDDKEGLEQHGSIKNTK